MILKTEVQMQLNGFSNMRDFLEAELSESFEVDSWVSWSK